MSLSQAEEAAIGRAVDSRESVLTQAAARVYLAKGNPGQWRYEITGAAILVRGENGSRSIKVMSVESQQIQWQTPLQDDAEYLEDRPYFHSFPSDKHQCMVGLSFANESEAKTFLKQVQLKDYEDKPSQPVARAPSTTGRAPPPAVPSNPPPVEISRLGAPALTPQRLSTTNAGASRNDGYLAPTGQAPISKSMSTPNRSDSSQSLSKQAKDSGGGGFFSMGKKNDSKGGKNKSQKVTKEMISGPSNFEHISHVGFDKQKGFTTQNIPQEWKLVFEKAGITEQQYREDKKIRKAVNKFMKEHGDEIALQSQTATAPPPPTRAAPAAGGPPPPPPPPGPPLRAPDSDERSGSASTPVLRTARSESTPDSRNQLLDAIQQGTKLRSVHDRQVSAPAPEPAKDVGDLAAILKAALQNRNQVMADSSDEDEEDEEEDWS
ncbi:uncharacterized protein BJ171DRAFT_625502 [Polychytrium aggregatum]|uniref:uncharacterized protein n=1 Tax=Polychytrium aggregatum TaxID=110093 RepID=UPI0022FDD5A1|nr:uncharacterized protein BJ171DRAFT_625502 [Polychytrium aggregatum]KAI9203078.1 hypothetical protein BJ171DRAFT_625502 [Polychytrium aggregatum]